MEKQEIQTAIESFVLSFPAFKKRHYINLQDLCDGMIFAEILKQASDFKTITSQMDESQGKWIVKLGNLKKIIKRLQTYVQQKLNKTIVVKDIDLIEICKNSIHQEIIKYFQLILAVLMQSKYKDDYIQKIMKLDEKSQGVFVNIIQNALQSRISISHKHQAIKLEDEVSSMRRQNDHIREELIFFAQANKKQKEEIDDLKEKLNLKSQQLQSLKFQQIQKSQDNLTSQLAQQRNITQNLKNKLISIARQHQMEISKYKQQLSILEIKLQHTQQLEDAVQMYKQRFTNSLKGQFKQGQWEKEKKKRTKQLNQKDQTIKRLNQQIQQVQRKSQTLQQKEKNIKLQLQKKDVKFKLLENQVRDKYAKNGNELPSMILQNSLEDERLQNHLQEMQFLKSEVQKLRNTNRQLERQSLKNKRKAQKMSIIQEEKKKFQRMVLQVTKSRDSEIQLLVTSVWELRNQNVKIFQLLKQTRQSIN